MIRQKSPILPLSEMEAAQTKSNNERIESEIADLEETIRKLRSERKCQYCGGVYYAKGYCVSCFNHLRAYGTLQRLGQKRMVTKEQSFSERLIKVVFDGEDKILIPEDFDKNYEIVALRLTERERLVIQKVIGERISQYELAKNLGISPQRVYQIYSTALRKLKNPRNSVRLVHGYKAEPSLIHIENEIDTLDVDIRIRNALYRTGANTIGDVVDLVKTGKIYEVRNIGHKAINVLNETLAEFINQGKENCNGNAERTG